MRGWRQWGPVLRFAACVALLAGAMAPGAARAAVVGAGLAWEGPPGARFAPVSPPAGGKTGFTGLPPERTGIYFTNELADLTVAQNRITESGSGVALGDVDGDGLCDIYFCRLEGDNVLYRNLGDWKFEDITASAGVACPGQYSTGAVLADIDGDGDLDLLVNSMGGGTRCFLNDGHGRFTELTESRLVRRFTSMSMALADANGDGYLDLFVANYSTSTYRDNPPGLNVQARKEGGRIVITPEDRFIPIAPRGGAVEVIEMGERDFLYLNDGHGRFLPLSWTNGAFLDAEGKPYSAPPRGWGLSVLFRDLNGDGLPDLYVCNDFFYFSDDIWMNVDGKQFRALPTSALPHVPVSSMAIDVADINRDGFDDLFVVEMLSRHHAWRHRQRPDMMGGRLKVPVLDPDFRQEVPHNALFLNRRDHTWTEISQLAGLHATEWSWGVAFLDIDLDGWEDLLVATGNNHDVQDADVLRENIALHEKPSPESRLRGLNRFGRLPIPSLAFRNQRDLTFREMSTEWGFHPEGIANGMALADLDNDGDLDIVINNLHGAAGIFRNDTPAPRVGVRLKGAGGNTRGIGAKIRVEGGVVPQTQEMVLGGRYLSSDDTMRVFAATPASPGSPLSIRVTWRSGRQTLVTNVEPNRVYEIGEADSPEAPIAPLPPRVISPIRFTDGTPLLGGHAHVDEPFNDFERQPLLAHSFSSRGPGVAWCDLDGDGYDDLIVGAGRNGVPGILMNRRGGGFTNQSTAGTSLWDQAGVVTVPGAGGKPRVLVGIENYEGAQPLKSAVHALDVTGQKLEEIAPAWESSAGALAVADLEGDGDLDLFVAGRVIPGRHPEPASSRLLLLDHGHWVPDPRSGPLFEKVGLVSGAVFTDLDGDGLPELVLACEWGPLRVYHNVAGRLEEVTEAWGFQGHTGWWNGVVAGDFDGDGRMDLAASNWGRNTRHQGHLTKPLQVYFGDFGDRGVISELECHFDSELGGMVPWRDWELVTREMPWIRERLNTYRSYGLARVEEILGDRFASARHLEAATLDSAVFLNRGGGRFEMRPLPIEAQFTPAFGICVADFDLDGREDLFLAQNFFGVTLETSRYDGGRGLALRGDGEGAFTAVDSGIKVYGEQRGAAVADFDKDGRPDLVIAQAHGPTRLYKNNAAGRGLRVRVNAGEGNPTGVGAVVRVGDGTAWGPAREIHGGSGYWSQDSPTLVMSRFKGGKKIQVRWPGGKVTESAVPPGSSTLEVDASGTVTQR